MLTCSIVVKFACVYCVFVVSVLNKHSFTFLKTLNNGSLTQNAIN